MEKRKKGMNTVAVVTELAEPICQEFGVTLWDVAFEKEGASWYLRVLIDRKDRPIDFVDCENVSRKLDKLLDEVDPIEQSYFLEVGSPGLNRLLKTKAHLEAYLGEPVMIRLIRPTESGQRDLNGILKAYHNDCLTIQLGDQSELQIKQSDTAYIKADDDDIEIDDF